MTTTDTPRPVVEPIVLSPDGGEALWFLGTLVTIKASSAAATKANTLFDTPALVSMMMTSAVDSSESSSMKFSRSSSERLAILEKPDAPATIWIPYAVSRMMSRIDFCFRMRW